MSSAKAAFCWMSFLGACLAVPVASQGTLDDNGCRTVELPLTDKVFTSCERRAQGPIDLPENFDVNLLPDDVTFLGLYTLAQGGVVHENFTALPPRDGLETILIFYYNERSEDIRFPLNGLLVNNKHHITTLALKHVKLLTLTAADFDGFDQLVKLKLLTVHLTSIHLNTFEKLGMLPIGQLTPNYQSTLRDLTISDNPELTGLDWSFLEPVSGSLKAVMISTNKFVLANVTSSRPTKLGKARYIRFNSNGLDRMPSAVFLSLNASLPLEIDMEFESDFCPAPRADCTCCEMAEFTSWLKANHLDNAVKRLKCGTIRTDGSLLLTRAGAYDHCSASAANQSSNDPHID